MRKEPIHCQTICYLQAHQVEIVFTNSRNYYDYILTTLRTSSSQILKNKTKKVHPSKNYNYLQLSVIM